MPGSPRFSVLAPTGAPDPALRGGREGIEGLERCWRRLRRGRGAGPGSAGPRRLTWGGGGRADLPRFTAAADARQPPLRVRQPPPPSIGGVPKRGPAP